MHNLVCCGSRRAIGGVRALVKELGANVNKANQDGATPLYVAAQEGHLIVVRALMTELGANVNQAAHDTTSLCISAQHGHLKVVRALMELGANVNQATQNGCTVVMVAAFKGHDQIVKWLTTYPILLKYVGPRPMLQSPRTWRSGSSRKPRARILSVRKVVENVVHVAVRSDIVLENVKWHTTPSTKQHACLKLIKGINDED